VRLSIVLLLNLAALLPLTAQTGVTPDWDVRTSMGALAKDISKLEPVVQLIKPKQWLLEGAPQTYVKQFESVQNSLKYLVQGAQQLEQEPARLTTAIDVLFRMQKMEVLLGSLKDGVRRYQSPDLADRLAAMLGKNNNHAERLREHITDLAMTREQEFQVVDTEAQRCRSALVQPEPKREKGSRK
jgi:hypothetical protein